MLRFIKGFEIEGNVPDLQMPHVIQAPVRLTNGKAVEAAIR